MAPKQISLEALPDQLRVVSPDARHRFYSIWDRNQKTDVEGSGIVILEWNKKPEVDLSFAGCVKGFEFPHLVSFWQVYSVAEGVRFHREDLDELALNELQTVELRSYFVSSEEIFFDYRLPVEASNAGELQDALSKCGTDADKEKMALVVVVPIADDETEFFFVESIEILNEPNGNEFARQPVLAINAFGSPGWTAFEYPSEYPKAREHRRIDRSLTPQMVQPGMTSHATKAKIKAWKNKPPFL